MGSLTNRNVPHRSAGIDICIISIARHASPNVSTSASRCLPG